MEQSGADMIQPGNQERARHMVQALLPALPAIIVLAAGCLIFGVPFGIECYQRNTSIPTAPVYPGSTLIESGMTPNSIYGLYGLIYETKDSQEDVIDFYASQGCDWWSSTGTGTECFDGRASPFGIYSVSLVPDAPADTVKFSVGIAWDRCPGDFNHRLIEG